VIGFNFDITHIYHVRHHKTVLSKTPLMYTNALWRFLINYSVFIVFYVRTGPTKVMLNLKNLLITMYVTSVNLLDGIVLISNDWKVVTYLCPWLTAETEKMTATDISYSSFCFLKPSLSLHLFLLILLLNKLVSYLR